MKRNHLKIVCPDETPAYLKVFLNGQPIERLISLRAEIPEGDGTPLLRVTLSFYSALDFDGFLQKVLKTEDGIDLST